MKNLIARFVREEEGQDLIEYALVATFVSLVASVGAGALGTNLDSWFSTMAGVGHRNGSRFPNSADGSGRDAYADRPGPLHSILSSRCLHKT